jgi:hypothetical protein
MAKSLYERFVWADSGEQAARIWRDGEGTKTRLRRRKVDTGGKQYQVCIRVKAAKLHKVTQCSGK